MRTDSPSLGEQRQGCATCRRGSLAHLDAVHARHLDIQVGVGDRRALLLALLEDARQGPDSGVDCRWRRCSSNSEFCGAGAAAEVWATDSSDPRLPDNRACRRLRRRVREGMHKAGDRCGRGALAVVPGIGGAKGRALLALAPPRASGPSTGGGAGYPRGLRRRRTRARVHRPCSSRAGSGRRARLAAFSRAALRAPRLSSCVSRSPTLLPCHARRSARPLRWCIARRASLKLHRLAPGTLIARQWSFPGAGPSQARQVGPARGLKDRPQRRHRSRKHELSPNAALEGLAGGFPEAWAVEPTRAAQRGTIPA